MKNLNVKKRNHHKKMFIFVVQVLSSPPLVRIYRVKKNNPELIGATTLIDSFSVKDRDWLVVDYLKKKGHVRKHHELERDFNIECV